MNTAVRLGREDPVKPDHLVSHRCCPEVPQSHRVIGPSYPGVKACHHVVKTCRLVVGDRNSVKRSKCMKPCLIHSKVFMVDNNHAKQERAELSARTS